MKLSKGIQFFAAPPPQIMTIYLSDNYSIGIGSDFDPVFTVGENFIEGNYSFNAPSSGTATDIDYTVSGNKITFTKNISGIGYTDFSTVNVAVGGTFSSGDTANHKFYVVPAATTQTTYDLTNLNLSAGNYAITVVAEAEGYRDSDLSNSVNYSVQAQLATPTIAMNADGKTLEITDVENATSYDVYVDGTLKTNVTKVVSKTLTFTGAKTDFLGGSETYAKIGSAPTSNNDYQYKYSQGGTYDFTGSVDVYIWGDNGANSGMYELNGTSQTNYVKVNGWSSPTKLTLTESTLICLYQAEMM